ncbi:MAG: hypothetical protein EHM25_14300 [Nitrosopumilales archaeon]|nr:MAG: hypothetical protein EHM25_14300 [Nitrosopumilales archaeon]
MNAQELTTKCLEAIQNILITEKLKLDTVDFVTNSIFCALFANSLLNVDEDKHLSYLEYRMKLLSEMIDACMEAVKVVNEKKDATIH